MFKNYVKSYLKQIGFVFCLSLVSTNLFAQEESQNPVNDEVQETQNISEMSEEDHENATSKNSYEGCQTDHENNTKDGQKDGQDEGCPKDGEKKGKKKEKPKDGWYGSVGFGLSVSNETAKKPEENIVSDEENLENDDTNKSEPFPVVSLGYRIKNWNFLVNIDAEEAVGLLSTIGYQFSEKISLSVGKIFVFSPATDWDDPYIEDREKKDINIESERLKAKLWFATLNAKQTRYDYPDDELGDRFPELRRSGTRNDYSVKLEIPVFGKGEFGMNLNVTPSYIEYEAKGEAQSYRINQLPIGLGAQIKKGINVGYTFTQPEKKFKSENPIVSKTREDKGTKHDLGLQWTFTPIYSLQASVNQEKTTSNIKLFESEKTAFNVLVTMKF